METTKERDGGTRKSRGGKKRHWRGDYTKTIVRETKTEGGIGSVQKGKGRESRKMTPGD